MNDLNALERNNDKEWLRERLRDIHQAGRLRCEYDGVVAAKFILDNLSGYQPAELRAARAVVEAARNAKTIWTQGALIAIADALAAYDAAVGTESVE